MDLKKLRELAQMATPAPWNGSMLRALLRYNRKHYLLDTDDFEDQSPMPNELDAAYVACANPTTVLSLLDTIERYKRALEQSCKCIYGHTMGDEWSFKIFRTEECAACKALAFTREALNQKERE